MQKGGAIYILTNINNNVLYTGVTNDLVRRIFEHRQGLNPKSFSAKYNVTKLVYYESFYSIEEAISRENRLKEVVERRKRI